MRRPEAEKLSNSREKKKERSSFIQFHQPLQLIAADRRSLPSSLSSKSSHSNLRWLDKTAWPKHNVRTGG